MPTMANLTVKKADGTTDVTYSAICPSSGDTVAAVWRNEAGGVSASLKASLTCSSKTNGARTARQVELNYALPWGVTDSTTGVTTVKNKVPIKVFAVIPFEVPDAVISEAIAQATNLFANSLIRSSLTSGYSPT